MEFAIRQRYFHNNFSEMNDQQKFIEILHHDNREGFVIRIKLNDSDKIHYATRDLNTIESYSNEYNTWISLNTFSRASKKATNTRSINCIYFDLDCHNGSQEYIDNCTTNTIKVLEEAYANDKLPKPTMITETGRGIGIFYVLRNSIANTKNTEKQINFWKYIYETMGNNIKEILKTHKYVLECDSTCIADKSRIVRMPLTVNQKNGKQCTLNYISYDVDGSVLYYDLSDFKPYLRDYKVYDNKYSKESRKYLKKGKIIGFEAYKLPFLDKRLKKLEKLQEAYPDTCANKRRELMCFYYYNAAKQIYPNAREMLMIFNQGFIEPLEEKELEHTMYTVDINKSEFGDYEGYYKISDKSMVKCLGLSEEEQLITGIGHSAKQINRENTKIKNRIKKQERNARILKDIIEHPEMTYVAIAELHNVSDKMVKRIAANNGIKRYKKNNSNDPQKIDNNVSLICDAIDNISSKEILLPQKGQKLPKSLKYGVYSHIDGEILVPFNVFNSYQVNNIMQVQDKGVTKNVNEYYEQCKLEIDSSGGMWYWHNIV